MISKRTMEGMVDIALRPVGLADLEALSRFASEIWLDYWPALIGEDQTRYMIDMFHSTEAMERDIREKAYEYWFVYDGDDNLVGYTGGHVEPETNRFFISKIYLLSGERGKGYASQIMRFYEELCRERALDAMYLTVNKHNELGIRAYKGKGLEVIEEVVNDIGNGFVMDDYVMEKRLR